VDRWSRVVVVRKLGIMATADSGEIRPLIGSQFLRRNRAPCRFDAHAGCILLTGTPSPLLTPSRPQNETAGDERERSGTRWSEPAGHAEFPLVEAGVRIPLAPPEFSQAPALKPASGDAHRLKCSGDAGAVRRVLVDLGVRPSLTCVMPTRR
jgi:hypothetical protein